MIEQFVELVRKYVALIDGLPGPTAREFLVECAVILPQIYSLSQQLPDVELPEDDPLEEKKDKSEPARRKISDLLGKYDVYSEIFDPVFQEEAIQTTLSDDLSDIYADLKSPLLKYDSEDEPNQRIAIWEWKFQMTIHWGHHVVSALRPIHSLIHDHLDPKYRGGESDA